MSHYEPECCGCNHGELPCNCPCHLDDDEKYDTQKDVEQDPCGAHITIQSQDAEIKSLQTELVLAHGQAEEALEVVATQDAKIKALVEAGAAVVRDAIRQDLHGNGALNDVVMPYLIDELSAAIAATKETT